MTTVSGLLESKRVVVVCGAGGVGKTTTSASLALTAARAGRRVLVITIDPSRRLAQTLGVAPDATDPVSLPESRQRAMGIQRGSLSAWMLDPGSICDRAVRELSGDAGRTRILLENRIYRHLTSVVAGMQEYAAVEALHRFVRDDRYDLVVLDTPPSRDALRFLDAPSRAGAFLDPRIFRLFVPSSGSRLRRGAGRILERLLDLGFGEQTRSDLQQFFALFEQVFASLNDNQGEMQRFFTSDAVSFLLVSSPAAASLAEAAYFEDKARELSLPLEGLLFNRSLACEEPRAWPRELLSDETLLDVERRALEKLERLAEREAAEASRHQELLRSLRERIDFVTPLPELQDGASELEELGVLAERLALA